MPRAIPIASIKGTTIRLHWTFLLLLAAITFGVALSGGMFAATQLVVVAVSLMFICVVAVGSPDW